MQMAEIIKLDNVKFKYPGDELPSLCGISLSIEEGSFVAVLGRNGSGKSTLAKQLNAIIVPDEGTITVCGMDTKDESKLLDIRESVGIVFQNPDNQIVANVVEEDVAFAPENLGLPPEEIRVRVDNALKEVGMEEFKKHAPHLLSGGQKQRVAIAGALAMEPRILVLDEPTAMLDPKGRKDVLETVHRLCREDGITIILITHHMEECIDADKIFVMKDGFLTMEGTPLEVFSKVEQVEENGLAVPETMRLLHDLNMPLDTLSITQTAKEIANG